MQRSKVEADVYSAVLHRAQLEAFEKCDRESPVVTRPPHPASRLHVHFADAFSPLVARGSVREDDLGTYLTLLASNSCE